MSSAGRRRRTSEARWDPGGPGSRILQPLGLGVLGATPARLCLAWAMPELVWLSKRLQARGETECALRVVEGHQEGLTGRWQHGVAALAPGLVTLRRRYV